MRFAHIEDVEAYYARVEASPEYARFFRPDADDLREARIASLRKPRIRKPTLRSVLAEARRAGVEVAQIEVTIDGRIVIVPRASATGEIAAQSVEGNPWDEVLQ